ncbi:uncharacterized protein FOMMEDRAFT_31998 [Fomitiporia mediterranea MF3/22]|uniref:uncharacterized protein n=1 Tax=Fomitiporia mediterranea (strain MF3/22) TaxID=694068 RepID=UPI0004407A0D|nr:uncharacterized protein FOMMEDRAFT_31998 [Fomitiporia mediterranea MF3/22]EJC98245.1 hypothetical protein FOMMEDRAFT_31998 [Fomitiporia mediterranea MF3/22]
MKNKVKKLYILLRRAIKIKAKKLYILSLNTSKSRLVNQLFSEHNQNLSHYSVHSIYYYYDITCTLQQNRENLRNTNHNFSLCGSDYKSGPITHLAPTAVTLSLHGSTLTGQLPVSLPRHWEIKAVSRVSEYNSLTTDDILWAVYSFFDKFVPREEWDQLGKGTVAQQQVSQAYYCRKELRGSTDLIRGMKRIDWLCGWTVLLGIEHWPGNNYELVFAKGGAV